MNKIKIFLAFAIAIISASACAQQAKPIFKTITIVAYQSILNGSNKAVFGAMYYSIRFYETDSLRYMANNLVKSFKSSPGYPQRRQYGMSDTAYRISDELVSKLNKIFNGKTSLKSHMITDKLPGGAEGYNDPVYFITYTTNNTSDTFIAVPPFLDKKLKGLLDQINALPRGDNRKLGKFYSDSDLETMVKDFEKTCPYIPAPTPPRVSKLEIADPTIKH